MFSLLSARRHFHRKINEIILNISPEYATRRAYKGAFHEKLDFNNPRGINQKIHYLKLRDYYDNPLVTQCIDKFRVRDYLRKKGYASLSAPLLSSIYSKAEDLRLIWDFLPSKFVIKCNHGCGYNIVVKNKAEVSLEDAIRQLDLWLKQDYWKFYCEVQYKFIEKGFFVEEYLAEDMKDYKFYCFNGQPRTLQVASSGENGEVCFYVDIFDTDWNLLPVTLGSHGHKNPSPEKPSNFEEMKRIAADLSADFPFVRVDLYDVNGRVFFGELTFVPTGGFMSLTPKETIQEWGSWLNLKVSR